jgi:hypothetical protein
MQYPQVQVPLALTPAMKIGSLSHVQQMLAELDCWHV